MEMVRIGQITAPVGIKGEVRVFPYTDRNSRFLEIKKVYLGNDASVYDVLKVREDKSMVVVRLSGIPDRNSAEALRGKYLYVPRDAYELDDSTYFTEDLIGCSVYSEEGLLQGLLKDIVQNPNQDMYEISKPDGGSFFVPAVKEFIKAVDVDNKKIVIRVIEGLID